MRVAVMLPSSTLSLCSSTHHFLFVVLGISLVWVAFIYQVGVLGDVMDMCKCVCVQLKRARSEV